MIKFDFRRGLGIALICASALMFQVFSTRLLSVVLFETLILFSISFALLGMGVAASLASIGKSPTVVGDRGLAWFAVALAGSYLFAFYAITQAGDEYARMAHEAMISGKRAGLFSFLRSNFVSKFAVFGSILFVPFLVFGAFLALLFNSIRSEDYHRFYAADLIGAASGSVLVMIVLDAFGFNGGLGLVILSALTGGALLASRGGRVALGTVVLAAVATVVAILSPSMAVKFEPKPPINLLSRNFDNDRTATVEWTRWNAHSRIAKIDIRHNSGKHQQAYAHETGDGWALVPDPLVPGVTSKDYDPTYRMPAVFEPKTVLVMFAGVGSDMYALDETCGGRCDITGVEINREMVIHARSSNPALNAFLNKPNIHLKVAEAREFLERDHKNYDSILLSWWGAGSSHYVGTFGQLSDYMYTDAAFRELLDHLNPGGTISLYNGSKAQVLAVFGRIFRERGLGDLAGKVVLLRSKQASDERKKGYFDTLEALRLMVKPVGFSTEDMVKLEDFASRSQMEIVLGRDGAKPGYETYWAIASGANADDVNGKLRRDFDVELSTPTDTRPFVNDLIPRSYYFSASSIFGSEGSQNSIWLVTRGIFHFSLGLLVIAVLLILMPVALRRGPGWSMSSARLLGYFSAVGAGFMFIEIGIMRKFGMMLGHPSYAVSVVLAALILSTGVGSFLTVRLRAAGLSLERSALAVSGYCVAMVTLYPYVLDPLIVLPFALKSLAVIVIIFPLGVLLGQFFARGLAVCGAVNQRLVPWAWAVNGTMSTIAASFGVYFSFPLGFDWIVVTGALLYLPIALGLVREHKTVINP